jgi:hypothetical protein
MRNQILMICTLVLVVLLGAGGIAAQDANKMKGGGMGMAGMKNDPHHKLMMAYMMTMSEFAKALRAQAIGPKAMDVESARAAVSELRHNLDAMEAARQKHMDAMSADMKANMKTMMDKMETGQTMVKEQIIALETAVQADQPDAKQVAMHANALLKHFRMMKMTPAGKKAHKKMQMKKKMKMTM